eukprot:7050245-Prorocentrum_lima.AAC.1
MTSSLVGSEMCIRDRFKYCMSAGEPPDRIRLIRDKTIAVLHAKSAVSYTHLTLPTSVDLGGR